MCIKEKAIANILKQPKFNLTRYMTLDIFCKCIENDSMLFNKPKNWRKSFDPFEDIISRFEKIENNVVFGLDITKDIYAQCWNSGDECDGMWRNFASLDKGVMVKTTNYKVVEWVINFLIKKQCFSDKKIYIRDSEIADSLSEIIKFEKVDYKEINELIKDMSSILKLDENNDITSELENFCTSGDYIKFLSKKGKHYKYEQEYRILLNDPYRSSKIEIKDDKLFVTRFNEIIKEIVFSPKFDDCEFEFYKNKLIDEYGIKVNIKKSTLYDVDNYFKNSNLRTKN